MTRRVRAFSIALCFVIVSIASQLTSPAWSAYQDAEPMPGESDEPQGDEGGDADEVLIQTNPTRPAAGRNTPRDIDSAAPALSWWEQILRWMDSIS
jgi:hypothetical protein